MWNRRNFLFAGAGGLAIAHELGGGPRVSITMDDFNWRRIPEPWRARANTSFLSVLDRHSIQAAGFVVGSNCDDAEGAARVQAWSDAGHLIGNHTWSHKTLDSDQMGLAQFEREMLRNDRFARRFAGFRPFFRFPALKEGNTAEKRDGMRAFLRENGYRNGYVTIDASDWYYDQRLQTRMRQEPGFDVNRYRESYLAHLADRADYYQRLALDAIGRPIPHTLLIHYNLLNVLFLDDLLRQFKAKGWRLTGAAEALQDPIFRAEPKILPAGESLVWAVAKESGRFESRLRYPGEDDVYEKPGLDRLGL